MSTTTKPDENKMSTWAFHEAMAERIKAHAEFLAREAAAFEEKARLCRDNLRAFRAAVHAEQWWKLHRFLAGPEIERLCNESPCGNDILP